MYRSGGLLAELHSQDSWGREHREAISSVGDQDHVSELWHNVAHLGEEMHNIRNMFGDFFKGAVVKGATAEDAEELQYILHATKPAPATTGLAQPASSTVATHAQAPGTSVVIPSTSATAWHPPLQPAPRPLPGLVPMGPGQPASTVFKLQLKARFGGSSDNVSCFIVAVDQFLRRWGHPFVDHELRIEYIYGHLVGKAAQWYVDLYEMGFGQERPRRLKAAETGVDASEGVFSHILQPHGQTPQLA